METCWKLLLALVPLVTVAWSGASPDVLCQPPRDNGRCHSRELRYFFNPESQQCEMFAYGGCEGSDERFSSLEECHDTCKTEMADPNPEAHVKSQRCLEGAMDPSVGNRECKAYFPRYTFNFQTLKCEQYIYGGCGAGPNLFRTELDCLYGCVHKAAEVMMARSGRIGESGQSPVEDTPPAVSVAPVFSNATNICMLPPNTLPISCQAFFPKWTFDWRQNRCVKYIYGGCGGSENLFDTEDECVEKCRSSMAPEPRNLARTIDVCDLPKQVGMCRGAMPRFAYNKNTRRCEQFIYGGCGGNANNFVNMQDCVAACGGMEPSTNVVCTHVQCDRGEMMVNQAKGCKPIIAPDECCPSSWDCSIWEERLKRKNECFVANADFPNGKFYSIGEDVPEADTLCKGACFCTSNPGGNAHITCAVGHCAAMNPDLGENCLSTYDDFQQCCRSSITCYKTQEEIPYMCELEGKSYVKGARIYPESDKCKFCHCQSGWRNNATLEENSMFCVDVNCGLSAMRRYLDWGCQPVFTYDSCCPTNWICPRPKPVPRSLNPTAAACPPGVRALSSQDFAEATRNIDKLMEAMALTIGDEAPLPPSSGSRVKRNASCLLPRPVSRCEGYLDRWFFDRDDETCKQFKFGGPEDASGNVFADEASCRSTCFLPTSRRVQQSVCSDPKSAGPCYAYYPKYYFDAESNTCQRFIYGGCLGNANKFDSLKECTNACSVDEDAQQHLNERCSLPAVKGRCQAAFKRWFHNTTARRCQEFLYGGCDGNGNNFQTEVDCHLACHSSETDQYAAADLRFVMGVWPQDYSSSARDFCLPPPESGACRAAFSRYYFDKDAGKCLPFTFGGCRGNSNNFRTQADCESKCAELMTENRPRMLSGFSSRSSIPPQDGGSICNLESDVGMCHGLFERYYFDRDAGECLNFTYGGCGGNNNNFLTLADCKSKCGKLMSEKRPRNLSGFRSGSSIPPQEEGNMCSFAPDVGMCYGLFERYYFDHDAGECLKFVYGGCGGNSNNFETMTDCESNCGKLVSDERSRKPIGRSSKSGLHSQDQSSICSLEPEAGLCQAFFPRYHYDPNTNTCKVFIYGGCQGNGNNFQDKSSCMRQCGSHGGSNEVALEEAKTCKFAGRDYPVGTSVPSSSGCTVCTCSSPPNLTCKRKKCSQVPPPEPNCEFVYDEDKCCVIGYKCL